MLSAAVAASVVLGLDRHSSDFVVGWEVALSHLHDHRIGHTAALAKAYPYDPLVHHSLCYAFDSELAPRAWEPGSCSHSSVVRVVAVDT